MDDDNSVFAPDPGSEKPKKKPDDVNEQKEQAPKDSDQDNQNQDAESPEMGQNSKENKAKEEEIRKKLAADDSTIQPDKNSAVGLKDQPDDVRKTHFKMLIAGAIMLLIFLIILIQFLNSGQKRQLNKVRETQTAIVTKEAKTNPKVRRELDNAQGKKYDAGKETEDKQLSKSQAKDQLNKYNAINSRSTLVMLKLHDAILAANKNKSLSDFQNALQSLSGEMEKNNNLLASVNQSGTFYDLYKISNQRTQEIIKLLNREQNSKMLSILTAEYNHQASKSNQENQQFLSAFKTVLDAHKIAYSVDENGNFSY